MARAMRFLDELQPIVVIFTNANFRRDRETNRDSTFKFSIPVNLELLKALPKPVVEAYAAMDKPAGQVEAGGQLRRRRRDRWIAGFGELGLVTEGYRVRRSGEHRGNLFFHARAPVAGA